MATWISNYLACLGLDHSFEPYFAGVLYDQNLSEEDKSATIYECLEENCDLENVNLQDAVAELFAQYAQGGLYWLEAPVYPYPTTEVDYHYQPAVGTHAIPIVRPSDELVGSEEQHGAASAPTAWARIDDDEQQPTDGPFNVPANGRFVEERDTLDPFDDDEFNPFAPPSASDLEVLNGARKVSYGSYQSSTEQQYPPPIFYGGDDSYGSEDDGSNFDQDMTPLEMLQLILQDLSPEKIEKAFAKSGYDMDNTLTALMSEKFPTDPDPLSKFVPVGDIRSTQTCRHFLQGNCFRKDCWYSHDLDSMVCKFWLKGQCLKGDGCEFNHFIDTSRMGETPAPAPVKQQPPAMDDFDFPSLSATTSTKSKGSARGSKSNGQQDVKKGAASVDALATQLEQKAKVSSPPLLKPAISYSATAAAAAAKPVTPLNRPVEDTEELRKKFSLTMAPTSIPWLETGSTLNSHYIQSRAKAIEYAKARNRCFEMAAQAYQRNDGASAAKYSTQGREYNDMMMMTHREASQEIFNARNSSMIKSGAKGETWIDLHGLHVDEALVFLDEFMERLEKEVYTGSVYVVTGTGNHSSNARAKLKPAVMDWLDSWGYVWKEMSVDKVHGGVLAIQVIKGKA